MSRVVVIIQARLRSQRLPKKVLADICGKPMLQHVVERARAIKGVDLVCLAVPYAEYFEFAPVSEQIGVSLYHGPGDDVLARYAKVAQETEADVIMRLTGDCALLDPFCCYEVLWNIGKDASFCTNDTRISGWPDGFDAECFKRVLLDQANTHATTSCDREHVTPWMRRSQFSYLVVCREPDDLSKMKLSVDTQADLNRVRRIMARIPAGEYSWQATQEAIRAELSEKP